MSNKKILIIEDEEALRRALREEFAHANFETLEAKDGEEGLTIALSAHPDLILLDIVMPVMDGMAMFKKLREDAWGKDAKVIILTNYSDDERVASAVVQQPKYYLVKSDWKIRDVVAKAKEILGG